MEEKKNIENEVLTPEDAKALAPFRRNQSTEASIRS